jgi:hypothetical protein
MILYWTMVGVMDYLGFSMITRSAGGTHRTGAVSCSQIGSFLNDFTTLVFHASPKS